MKLILIAAVSKNLVIGRGQKLPWHIPDDLKRFKAVTSGHPCVMGRKTLEAIGKPLPGRDNWVITRDPNWPVPAGVRVVHSKEEALEKLEKAYPGDRKVYCLGGGEIYKQFLSDADELDLTLIDQEVEGDAYFPVWESSGFKEISSTAGVGQPSHRFVLMGREVEKKPV